MRISKISNVHLLVESNSHLKSRGPYKWNSLEWVEFATLHSEVRVWRLPGTLTHTASDL